MARRPEVGRCRRRVSGSAVNKKKKTGERRTEQAGKKGTSRMRMRVGMHLYGSVCEREREKQEEEEERKESSLLAGTAAPASMQKLQIEPEACAT